MNKLSRRTLARYAVEQLLAGRSAATIAKAIAAVASESNQTVEPEFLMGDIAWELERRGELVIGRVTTTRSLSDEVHHQLSEQVKKATAAKEILLEQKLDDAVIGGLRIETANRVWDFTLARKLTQLREAFNA